MTAVALGLSALRGGAVTVGVALEAGQPRVLLSRFLATAADDDRLAREPYHVAAELGRGADGRASAEAHAAVAEGRKRQARLAAAGLQNLVTGLRADGCEIVAGALLVNRAGWVTDLLEYSLAYPDHPPVAEGLAVRDALRSALGDAGIAISEIDEKSLAGRASLILARDPVEIEAQLKALGASVGPPWRKEQKLACLAAWTALAESR